MSGSSGRRHLRARWTELERLHAALETVARLMIGDPVYTPIFERLEREIEIETAAQVGETAAQARARTLLRQRDTGSSSALSISNDPPSP